MKKSIIALTLLLVIGAGFSAVSALAFNCGGPGSGYGMMRNWGGNDGNGDNAADVKKFLDETVKIRKAIRIDSAELNALMAGENPDPKRVRELTASIVDNEEALAEIARSSNISGGFGRGYGLNPNCSGPGGRACGGTGNCNGTGAGRCFDRN